MTSTSLVLLIVGLTRIGVWFEFDEVEVLGLGLGEGLGRLYF